MNSFPMHFLATSPDVRPALSSDLSDALRSPLESDLEEIDLAGKELLLTAAWKLLGLSTTLRSVR